jgi:hypothetical protein
MANGYYSGAPNAFAGGQLFAHDLTKRRLQMNALNALIGRFGDEAAMPAEQSMLQLTEQRTQLQPHVVGAAERATAGAEANVQEFGPQAGDPEAEEIERRRNEQRRNILHRAVSALKMVRDKEGDLPGALQQFGQIVSRIGMPANELTDLQQNILTNPDSLDELDTMLRGSGTEGVRAIGQPTPVYDAQGVPRLMQSMTDGSTRIIEGVRPAATVLGEERNRQSADRLAQGWNRLSLDQAKARGFNAPDGYEIWEDPDGVIHAAPIPGSKAQQEVESKLQAAQADDATYARAAEIVTRRGQTVAESSKTALDYFRGARGGVILQNIRRGAPLAAGTDMYDAWQALEIVRGAVAVRELEDMRKSSANGASGFGQLTERELELLRNAEGVLTTTTDPEILVNTLERVQESFGRVLQIVEADAAAAQRRIQERQQRYPNLRAPTAPGRGGASRGAPPGPDATPEEILRYYAPPDGN